MAIPVHFYVWYHATGDMAATRVAVAAMIADVSQRTGVMGRFLVRRNEPSTWMEIYEDVNDVAMFERELADAVLRHRIAQIGGMSERHVEAFVAVD